MNIVPGRSRVGSRSGSVGRLAGTKRRAALTPSAFKRIKVTEIAAVALIPFLTGQRWPYMTYIVGSPGVIITVLEGLLHLKQCQTAEAVMSQENSQWTEAAQKSTQNSK